MLLFVEVGRTGLIKASYRIDLGCFFKSQKESRAVAIQTNVYRQSVMGNIGEQSNPRGGMTGKFPWSGESET